MRARVGVILLGISVSHALVAQQILHPENLAGRWEAPDGHRGAVGMSISLTTTVPSSTTDLIGLSQTLEDFEIGIYQRSDSDVNPLGFNFFTISANGGATWDGEHLRIDVQRRAGISPEIHIDLAWHEAARIWTGTFERAAFRNQAITLRRPAGHQASPFVGTWFESSSLMNNCLHIAQAQDGTFTGWGDDIQIPSRTRYANGIRPTKRAMEHYGEIAKAKVTEPHHIEVELRAYTPACCSHPFTATISRDGNTLLGDWLAGQIRHHDLPSGRGYREIPVPRQQSLISTRRSPEVSEASVGSRIAPRCVGTSDTAERLEGSNDTGRLTGNSAP